MRLPKFLFSLVLPVLGAASFTACVGDSADRGVASEGERGNLGGKADALFGSCEDACGGPSDGSCWCDEKCAEYGDCCEDVAPACELDQCIPGDDDTCPDDLSCKPGVCLAFCLVDDPGCCAPATCVDYGDDDDDDDDDACAPMDAHGKGLCEAFFGYAWNGDSCVGLSGCSCVGDDCGETYFDPEKCEADHAECTDDECAPVVCALFCEHGFETDEDGCEVCSCADPDPSGGSCEGNCGTAADDKSCFCDEKCEELGDCCDDFAEVCEDGDDDDDDDEGCEDGDTMPAPDGCNTCFCSDGNWACTEIACLPDDDDDERTVAEGQCVKNSLDACESDEDCMAGGCGGELCFNPDEGNGFSTCECTTPQGPTGCGCVEGVCAWYD